MIGDPARWLFDELVDPEEGGWVCDMPWAKANMTLCHRFYVPERSGVGVGVAQVPLARVKHKDCLRQYIYGNPVNDLEDMYGLSSFYNTMCPSLALSAVNVFDCGGRDGQLTSIWVLGFGPNRIYGVTADGEPPMYLSDAAIVVEDWRYGVRFANLNPKESHRLAAFIADKGLSRLPRMGPEDKVRPIIWANEDGIAALGDHGLKIPVRRIDAIRNDEELVPPR